MLYHVHLICLIISLLLLLHLSSLKIFFFTRRVVVEREVLHKMRDNCWVSDVYLLIFIMSNFSNGFMSPLCEIFQLYTHLCGTHQTRFYYSYNDTMQVLKIASIKILQSFFHSHYKQRMKRQKNNYLQFFLMINFKKKVCKYLISYDMHTI